MRRTQALLAAIAIIFMAASSSSSTTRPSLQEECDALLRSAVRKPYGWAWPVEDSRPVPPHTQVVGFAPPATPTIALTLHRAGQKLNRPDYCDAARQAARGILAVQQSPGWIPAVGLFGASAGARRDPVIDRAPTCAAIALFLTLYDPNDPATEPFRRGALRAVHWLLSQQTSGGGWPILYQPDEKTAPARILRLDTPDYRNCTLAILLAAEVLQNKTLHPAVTRSVQQLLRLRLDDSKTARGLYLAAYELDGRPCDLFTDQAEAVKKTWSRVSFGVENGMKEASSGGASGKLPTRAADILATRHALVTLLAVRQHLPASLPPAALEPTLETLNRIAYTDKIWHRLYPLRGNELAWTPLGPSPRPDTSFGAAAAAHDPELLRMSDFDLPPLLSNPAPIDIPDLLTSNGRSFDR